ncbi:MAG: alanine--glyoxylate aminotransferase family protein [Planctomycetes bacterium]|nr:alanine--glyoxylate aminotransferase family protein [Planctomycetota bacterium]
MIQKPRIFTPGPTALLPQAAQAEAAPQPHHRSVEFAAMLRQARAGLAAFFNTRHDVVLLTASGTGGLEAAAGAAFSHGQRVVCVNAGKFGARWSEIARALGAQVVEVTAQPGQPVRVEEVLRALQAAPTAALFVQGCETSTATLHPVRELAALVRGRPETLMCVDGITWLGAHEVRPDDWGIDLLVGASQKALAMSPGLSFVSVSEKAAARMEVSGGAQRYYFDLGAELKAQRAGETRFTPAISLISALVAALQHVQQVGLDVLVANAAHLAAVTRAGFKALGLNLVSSAPADSVTAVFTPAGVPSSRILSLLQQRHGIALADGQDGLKNLVIRVAHLGYYDYIDCVGVLAALEDVLLELGLNISPGTALEAAQQEHRRRQ